MNNIWAAEGGRPHEFAHLLGVTMCVCGVVDVAGAVGAVSVVVCACVCRGVSPTNERGVSTGGKDAFRVCFPTCCLAILYDIGIVPPQAARIPQCNI